MNYKELKLIDLINEIEKLELDSNEVAEIKEEFKSRNISDEDIEKILILKGKTEAELLEISKENRFAIIKLNSLGIDSNKVNDEKENTSVTNEEVVEENASNDTKEKKKINIDFKNKKVIGIVAGSLVLCAIAGFMYLSGRKPKKDMVINYVSSEVKKYGYDLPSDIEIKSEVINGNAYFANYEMTSNYEKVNLINKGKVRFNKFNGNWMPMDNDIDGHYYEPIAELENETIKSSIENNGGLLKDGTWPIKEDTITVKEKSFDFEKKTGEVTVDYKLKTTGKEVTAVVKIPAEFNKETGEWLFNEEKGQISNEKITPLELDDNGIIGLFEDNKNVGFGEVAKVEDKKFDLGNKSANIKIKVEDTYTFFSTASPDVNYNMTLEFKDGNWTVKEIK